MTQPLTLSPPLAALAADPSQVRVATLWAALPAEDRKRAISLAAAGDRQLRAVLIAAIRKTPRYKSFRADSFKSWTPEQIAAAVQGPGVLPPEAMESGLVALHLGDRAQMLGTFLDALGIPHDGGLIREGADNPSPGDEELARAADGIAGRFPPDLVATYMMTLLVVDPVLWGGLKSWLAGRTGIGAVR
jgi:hypothetical protein